MVEGKNRKDIIVIDILERCNNKQRVLIRQNDLIMYKGHKDFTPSYFLNESVKGLCGYSIGFDDFLVIDII